MKNFRNLKVWHMSHEFALLVYKVTRKFLREELFGLTSQIRRAALSIPTNIAEGCGRRTDSDFAKFIQIAFGSASEAEYLVFFSREIDYITQEEFEKLNCKIIDIKKSLTCLIKTLKSDN